MSESSKIVAYQIAGAPTDKIASAKLNMYVIIGTITTVINTTKLNAYVIVDSKPPPVIGLGNMFMLF